MTGQHRPRRAPWRAPAAGRRPTGRAPGAAGPKPPKAPRLRAPASDPARLTAYDVLAGRPASATPTPTCVLPGLLRERRLDRPGRRASPPSSPTARCARRAPSTRCSPACVDRPLDRAGPAGAGPAAARRLPAAAHPGPDARRGRHHRRPGPAGCDRRAGRASSTRCCARSPPATWRAGCAELAPGRPARAGWRWPPTTRSGSSGASRDALGGDLERDPGRAAGRRRPRPRCTWWPGRIDRGTSWSRRSGGTAGPVVAVRRPAGRRRPRRRWPPVRDGRAGVQDEGSQLVALALAARAARGPRRGVARPVRRPGRQGRAARRRSPPAAAPG